MDDQEAIINSYSSEINKHASTKKGRAAQKFIMAALGSIPWVGGFLAAAASFKIDESTAKQNQLQTDWLKEHQSKLEKLHHDLNKIDKRFDKFGENIADRIQSEPYLDLVRKSFRSWDRSDTDEKRRYIGNLIANAAGTSICSDDVIRLFIDWLNLYHEAHFAVVKEIYKDPGCTRYDIWSSIHGHEVREDSAEADLYRLLIRDLSMGGVIRQARETTIDGKFIKSRIKSNKRRASSRTMEPAFEDTKPYVLTELGKQFVHYTMTELVPRITGS